MGGRFADGRLAVKGIVRGNQPIRASMAGALCPRADAGGQDDADRLVADLEAGNRAILLGSLLGRALRDGLAPEPGEHARQDGRDGLRSAAAGEGPAAGV
jgi:hypothetical protein